MDSHEKYLELCAASTAGELGAEEELDLTEHLANCPSCRQAKHEFELAVEKGIPALETAFPSHLEESDTNWSVEKAEAAFFERLRTDKSTRPTDAAIGTEKIREAS